ncbi:MAG: glycoside hydrolase family 3 N-terminal domain-containing protein, partial [Pseudomonadota bacterium]
FEDIDPTVPATASPKVVLTVREQIGFVGLLMTDDIGMNALSGTVEERVVASLAAGCDLILHCNGDMDERERVAAVVPALAGRAAVRADAALALRPRETAHA